MAVSDGNTPAFGGLTRHSTQTIVPVGGVQVLSLGSSNFGIYVGSGSATVSATKGSIYIRTDGSNSGTRLSINTTGSTIWTPVTTAA